MERAEGGTDLILSSSESPTDAILQEAMDRHADLIVVGTRPHATWFDRVRFGSVANEVIDRGERSVLVAPLSRLAGPDQAEGS